jgi:SAM-dependent methyltransferase
MRNWQNIDRYLTQLATDIYPQPEDVGHTALAQKVVNVWMSRMTSCKSVLDLGCGTGFAQPMFEKHGVSYEGVALGEDYLVAVDAGRNVKKMDFHFLDYPDKSFDLLFARHSLEHSPMPLLALMEWARVSRSWLGLVLPAPEWYGFAGLNHYSVMNHEQIENLVIRAGWRVLWNEVDNLVKDRTDENPQGVSTPHEYWYMLEKATI